MGKKFVPTEEQKELLLKLYNEGNSVNKITKQTKMASYCTIHRILTKMGCLSAKNEQKSGKICNICGDEFSTNYKSCCNSCWTIRERSKIKEAIKDCKTRTEVKNKFKNYYSKIFKYDWIDLLPDRVRDIITVDDIRNFIVENNLDSIKSLQIARGSYYNFLIKNKIDPESLGLERRYIIWDLDMVKSLASNFQQINDFKTAHSKAYSHLINNYSAEVREEVFAHMVSGKNGFGKNKFQELCEKYNNGNGILYLIKMYSDDEWFYKIGVTSQSVYERYKGLKSECGYSYDLIWEIQLPSDSIYDLEKEKHRETKSHRYQPNNWPNIAKETFKCHGNSKLLRKPKLD